MKEWKCTVCGRIFEGDEPPIPCPVCKAGREAFIELAAAATLWKCAVCGRIFEGNEPPVPCPVCKAGREAFTKISEAPSAYHTDTDAHYVIVGGGVAGIEAAKTLRQHDGTGSITVVAEENCLPYNRPILSTVVAKGLPLEKILLEPAEYYEQHNIRLLMGVRDVSIDPDAKMVSLSDGQVLPYTKLLLATGSRPFNPIQTGEGGVPVRVLRSFIDAEELVHAATGKRVVLVGGGILGLEAAVALHGHGCHISIVEFAPRLMSLQADEEASCRLQKAIEAMGIQVYCGASVQSTDATGAVLNDGTHIDCDLVLASMGVRSEVGLATSIGLTMGRGIVVDDVMRTSAPDIWAAGDCAEYEGRVVATAGVAMAMGRVAGASMAGDQSQVYRPIVPAAYFSCPGFIMLSVGAVQQDTAEYTLYQDDTKGIYRRLVFKDGVLGGVLFVGNTSGGANAVQAVERAAPIAEALALLVP